MQHHQSASDLLPQQQAKLLNLIEEEIKHLKGQNSHHHSSTEEDQDQYQIPENVYFDKQLTHLVLSEEFDFKEISKILTTVFRFQQIDASENACRLRWAQLHQNRINREQIKQKIKEDKRTRSVAAFANPYSLYSVDELIENLEARQKMEEVFKQAKIPEPTYDGYNIFKDNFRKIKNLQEYSQMEEQMKNALKLAQQDVYEERPLFFSPEYENSSQFKVKQEEMTAEKVRKLMAFQIQMEKVGREFNRTDPYEHQKYESMIRKKVEKQSRRAQNDGADFDDDWDGYESD